MALWSAEKSRKNKRERDEVATNDELTIKIAFFKGDNSSRLHRFIRWWTKSPYSHAELVMPDGVTWVSISPFLSSRVALRIKTLPDPQSWDYLEFPLSWRDPVREYQLEQLQKFIEVTQGSKYDWIGMILSHLSSYVIKRKDRWYCSEWIAHALVYSRIVKWDDVHLYGTPDLNPGKLYKILADFQNKNCTT